MVDNMKEHEQHNMKDNNEHDHHDTYQRRRNEESSDGNGGKQKQSIRSSSDSSGDMHGAALQSNLMEERKQVLATLESQFETAKSAATKDYTLLKTLKNKIEGQRSVNEKADLLHAELSIAEQSEDFDKCEMIETKLKEIPKTVAEAKAIQFKKKSSDNTKKDGPDNDNNDIDDHPHNNTQNNNNYGVETNEMILRMQRDLNHNSNQHQLLLLDSPERESIPTHKNNNIQELRNVPIGILGEHEVNFKGQKDGEALLSRLNELIDKVPLEDLRVESIERKQKSYSIGDRVVVSLTHELRRPKGEVVYGPDVDGRYSVQIDPVLPFGVLSGRRPIRTSKRRMAGNNFSGSESGFGDDDTASSMGDARQQEGHSNQSEYQTAHGSQLALISTPMDELVAMVAVAAHSGNIPTRIISEAKTILRDLVVREQAASDELDAWAELDAEERRLIRKERDARYGGVSLGGGDRSSTGRVNARIISKRERGGSNNAFAGVLENSDRNSRSKSSNDVNRQSRTLQRHLSRSSVSSSRVRSSSPRISQNSRSFNSQSAPRPSSSSSSASHRKSKTSNHHHGSSSSRGHRSSSTNHQGHAYDSNNDLSNDDSYASPNEHHRSSHRRRGPQSSSSSSSLPLHQPSSSSSSAKQRSSSSLNRSLSTSLAGGGLQQNSAISPYSSRTSQSQPPSSQRSHKSNHFRMQDFTNESDDDMLDQNEILNYGGGGRYHGTPESNKDDHDGLVNMIKETTEGIEGVETNGDEGN
eukprot:CAMPEP_0114373692 /NCGR_PEP_ID=MMETSP0101-20121206/35043_1 /TAXON_ID=38822 ORGANISM="Pteridomonas danica, Strain PT" /NCGR_SAMPLE_ID=MMETSP0101 /ASSEMBLY_ACC=CAM_ASM_000211 /LENGTH=753 /DNA_ID=CAMNT_0001527033 /DNA_START=903 /DNA_END=3165 /DNA_ORIENTATION=+